MTLPLISSGADQVCPWSVDIEPKIGDSQNAGAEALPPRQFGLNLNTVQVTYTLSRLGLFA